jgi:hypothetical protein
MRMKCIVPKKDHSTIAVSRETHMVLKQIADEADLPMTTITYYLLRYAIYKYYNIKLPEYARPEDGLKNATQIGLGIP